MNDSGPAETPPTPRGRGGKKLRTALLVLAFSAVPLGLLYAFGPGIPVRAHRMFVCRLVACSLAADLARACTAVTERTDAAPAAQGEALLESFWSVDGVQFMKSLGLAAPETKLGLWRAERENAGQPPCPAVERLLTPR